MFYFAVMIPKDKLQFPQPKRQIDKCIIETNLMLVIIEALNDPSKRSFFLFFSNKIIILLLF